MICGRRLLLLGAATAYYCCGVAQGWNRIITPTPMLIQNAMMSRTVKAGVNCKHDTFIGLTATANVVESKYY